MTAGYHSLIQYCPDLSRLEAANIGVVLFCPAPRFLGARTTESHGRIRQFFGLEHCDEFALATTCRSLERRLAADGSAIRTLDDLQRLIDTRGNAIQLTSPRPMQVGDPERDLSNLFETLVAESPSPEKPSAGHEEPRETFSPGCS